MSFVRDPDGQQLAAIIEVSEFPGKNVLEVGCGDGTLTFGYASTANSVTAIDPSEEDISLAREAMPRSLAGRVNFVASDIGDYAPEGKERPFDLALFGWSL
jgi:2-polyprenyl-3-methyl-5-hydroxy-6-metoxy-1,4-benzoquinol methylase